MSDHPSQRAIDAAFLSAGAAKKAIRLWDCIDSKRKRPHDTYSIALELGGAHLEPAVCRSLQAYRDFVREQAGFR